MPDEFLAFERATPYKHELLDGRILDRVGASRDHSVITARVMMLLGMQMRGRGCAVYASDLRIGTPRGDFFYPALSIVCGPETIDRTHGDILFNPTAIIEVLRPSTEAYDRGEKFYAYQTLPSLQHYVLIAQDRPQIEVFTRHESGWLLTCSADLDGAAELPAIGCTLPLREVYEQVSFAGEAG
ncbi:MAG: Uma2 family endonuclease [Candidatus Flexifilum sp.]|jgi:Uma2 family endonuclease